jgi:hypothetical protein
LGGPRHDQDFNTKAYSPYKPYKPDQISLFDLANSSCISGVMADLLLYFPKFLKLPLLVQTGVIPGLVVHGLYINLHD